MSTADPSWVYWYGNTTYYHPYVRSAHNGSYSYSSHRSYNRSNDRSLSISFDKNTIDGR